MIRFNEARFILIGMLWGQLYAAGGVNPASSTIDFPHDQAYINANQPAIIGTLRDVAGSPISNETVQILINGYTVGTVLSDENGIYRFFVPTVLADGQYQLSIFCVESQSSLESNTFYVDTTFPSVTITYPQANDYIASNTITITGTTEALAMVMTFLDGDTFGNICYADQYGHWSIDYDVTSGEHSIEAQATDIAGNTGPVCGATHFTVSA